MRSGPLLHVAATSHARRFDCECGSPQTRAKRERERVGVVNLLIGETNLKSVKFEPNHPRQVKRIRTPISIFSRNYSEHLLPRSRIPSSA